MPGDKTIIAAFRSSADAEAAAADLKAAGISADDIYLENGSGQTAGLRASSKEGGFTGWLKSIFGEENDADRSNYEAAMTRGQSLLRIDASQDQLPVLESVLERHSPIDVHGEGQAVAARATGAASGAIPVVQEDIQVGKREVLRGGVRVYSRVVEEPVEESVRLREERVRVERTPVNRAATDADLLAGQEQVIEVQEFAEEPVIAKQARVVEEVRVGKDVSERTETIRDTVRHTEVDVEETPAAAATKDKVKATGR